MQKRKGITMQTRMVCFFSGLLLLDLILVLTRPQAQAFSPAQTRSVLVLDVKHDSKQEDQRQLQDLIQRFQHNYHSGVRTAIIREIARCGFQTDTAIDFLIQATFPRYDLEIRRAATQALIGIGEPVAMPIMKYVRLCQYDIHKCSYLLNVITELGPEARAAVPDLIRLLDEENGLLKIEAAGSLAAIGAEARGAIPHLTKALHGEWEELQIAAAKALGAITAQEAIEDLIVEWPTGHYTLRHEITQALGRMGKSVILHALDILEDETLKLIHKEAILVLEAVGPEAREAVPSLRRKLKENDPGIRRAAAEALEAIGPAAQAAVSDLIMVLRNQDEDPHVLFSAAMALGSIGLASEPAVKDLKQLLRTEQAFLRAAAAEALADIGARYEDVVVALLSTKLYNRDERTQRAVKKALNRLDPDNATSMVFYIQALQSNDPALQAPSAEDLGAIGYRAHAAVPELIRILVDPDANDRLARISADTLGKIGEPAALPLAKILKKRKTRGIHLSVIQALAQMGKEADAAVPALRRSLGSRNPEVRNAADRVIYGITGKRVFSIAKLCRDHPAIQVLIAFIFMLLMIPVLVLLSLLANRIEEKRKQRAIKIIEMRRAENRPEDIVKYLKSYSRDIWNRALLALKSMRAVDIMAGALADTSTDVQRALVETLHGLLPEIVRNKGLSKEVFQSICASLCPKLNDDDADTRGAAVRSLIRFGPHIAPWLARELRKKSIYTIQLGIINALEGIAVEHSGTAATSEVIIPALKRTLSSRNSRNADVAFSAAMALTKLNWLPKTAQEKIDFALASHDWENVASFGIMALPALKQALRHYSLWHKDILETFGKIGSQQIRADEVVSHILPELIRFLKTVYPEERQKAAVSALETICTSHSTVEKICEPVVSALIQALPLRSAHRALSQILSQAALSEGCIERLLEKPLAFEHIFLLWKERPELFAGRPEALLIERMHRELENLPAEEIQNRLQEFSTSIAFYLQKVKNRKQDFIEIAHLLAIVHSHLPLCLKSLSNLDLSIRDIHELIRTLPLNNPLTRIIRMLGESPTIIGGFQDVVSSIKEQGTFLYLYRLILEVVEKKQRSAPQEIAGMLEILREYYSKSELTRWNASHWKVFSSDIQSYYNAGLKVVTLPLFKHFQECKNDPAALRELRSDIERELRSRNVPWGAFFGLSDDFKAKYHLEDLDEIALVSRYLQISNLSGRDYERAYRNVCSALQEKRPEQWQGEIPRGLRTLYVLQGIQLQTVYEPEESEAEDEFNTLFEKLSEYALDKTSSVTLKAVIDDLASSEPGRCQALLIGLLLKERSEDEKAVFTARPENDAERRKWLSCWHTLLSDTFQYHFNLDSLSDCLVREAGQKIDALEKTLDQLGFKWVDIAQRSRLFKPDRQLVKSIHQFLQDSREDELKDAFKGKWLSSIPYRQIKNDRIFHTWVEGGFEKFIRRLEAKKNSGHRISEDDQSSIKTCLYASRTEYLKTAVEIKQRQIGEMLKHRMKKIFVNDLTVIRQQLGYFREREIPSKEQLYTGFFDDLLHVAGEFMMSGVCTWQDRARQVREGAQEGYHFGTLALKDEMGRVLGFSQAQLLKTPLSGVPDRNNQGFRVLALTGLNLSQKEMPIKRRRAVMALLETARKIEAAAGLQAAVLVFGHMIHSNQADVQNFIAELASKGFLKPARMSSSVVLSRMGASLSYERVYVIQAMPEINLQAVTSEKLIVEKEQEQNLLEKWQLPFSDYFGHIVYGSELPHAWANRLRDTLEGAIDDMPKDILFELRMHHRIQDIGLMVIYEPCLKHSTINCSEKETILYLTGDVLYAPGKIHSLHLRQLVAEVLASRLLTHYKTLKTESSSNENAYFKIEIIKALLTYKSCLPFYYQLMYERTNDPHSFWDEKEKSEQQSLIRQMREELDHYTRGSGQILQWNLFLNVMDDADPALIVSNYLHLLLRQSNLDERTVTRIIHAAAEIQIEDKSSIARIRNVIKDFIFHGEVRLKIGEEIKRLSMFHHFDQGTRLAGMKDRLSSTKDQNIFYRTFRRLIGGMLPLTKQELDEEMSQILEADPFGAHERGIAIQDTIQELLMKRIGKKAFTAFKKHFSARRQSKEIPHIRMLRKTLPAGEDADDYGVLRYILDREAGYRLMFGDSEETALDQDWVRKLFLMQAPENEEKNSPS